MQLLLFLLLLLSPAISRAETRLVQEVLIGAREPLSRPSMEADRIERAMARGAWEPPVEGATDANGVRWRRVQTDENGWIRDAELGSSYAYATVISDDDRTDLLEAMGYAAVSINGEIRIGNVYGARDQWESWEPAMDYSLVPVRLRRGVNHFLFFGNRHDVLRARLRAAESALLLNPRDVTLPDLVLQVPSETWGAIVVLNATGDVMTRARLEIELQGSIRQARTKGWQVDVPVLPPYGVRKVAFPIHAPAFQERGAQNLQVAVVLDGKVLDTATLHLQVKAAAESRRVTFMSEIDSSVQFYGYLPAGDAPQPRRAGSPSDMPAVGEEPGAKALILSLHGAGVDALNQAAAYAPLSWGHLLAPTNRRPFGFSWEGWGRLDALEVLEQGLTQLQIDPDRIYLTGHSMGGHGSWHLATLHPDRFAAVGPSAGWISLWSYRMEEPPGPETPLAALVERANLQSRTLRMAPNLAGLGVYVLHGAEDDNVPVAQADLIVERLKEFHHDFVYHEQPGVGHWWDSSDEPGVDCVTWAPMFDFFAHHRRPRDSEVREVHFMTPSSKVSAWNHWVCIASQQRSHVMSRIDLRLDPLSRHVSGTTANVATLGLNLAHAGFDSLRLDLDGESLRVPVPPDGMLWLSRQAGWRPVDAPDPDHKGMWRDGTFREAFGNRMQLVYGTRGTAEENAWALAKARYDAEFLWYQGNASIDVLPDTLFDPAAEPERNVVLYGNAETHAHWQALWDDAVLSVQRGRMRLGKRRLEGEGLAVLAVGPRPGSRRASVGIVSGTGMAGMHLTDRRPYLSLGVAYPDVTVFEDRGANEIVRAAGFFGNDWSLQQGEILWAEAP